MNEGLTIGEAPLTIEGYLNFCIDNKLGKNYRVGFKGKVLDDAARFSQIQQAAGSIYDLLLDDNLNALAEVNHLLEKLKSIYSNIESPQLKKAIAHIFRKLSTSLNADNTKTLFERFKANTTETELRILILQLLIDQDAAVLNIPYTFESLQSKMLAVSETLDKHGIHLPELSDITFVDELRDPGTSRSSGGVVNLEKISSNDPGFIISVVGDQKMPLILIGKL